MGIQYIWRSPDWRRSIWHRIPSRACSLRTLYYLKLTQRNAASIINRQAVIQMIWQDPAADWIGAGDKIYFFCVIFGRTKLKRWARRLSYPWRQLSHPFDVRRSHPIADRGWIEWSTKDI